MKQLMIFIFVACVLLSPCFGTGENKSVVVFQIGEEDGSDQEFMLTGFEEVSEYTCQIDRDNSTETFPGRLNRNQNQGNYSEGGVEYITITFTLDKGWFGSTLRLVRGGDETTIVTVDPMELPRRMVHESGYYSPMDADSVAQVVIKFELDHDYDRLILRLSRAGNPDTLVTLDNDTLFKVTSGML